MVMEQILMRTNEGFTRLQGMTTLLSQQQPFLNELVSDFCADHQAIVLPNLAISIKLTHFCHFREICHNHDQGKTFYIQ
jgi:hypothetical protein